MLGMQLLTMMDLLINIRIKEMLHRLHQVMTGIVILEPILDRKLEIMLLHIELTKDNQTLMHSGMRTTLWMVLLVQFQETRASKL